MKEEEAKQRNGGGQKGLESPTLKEGGAEPPHFRMYRNLLQKVASSYVWTKGLGITLTDM